MNTGARGHRFVKMLTDSDGWLYPYDWDESSPWPEGFEIVWVCQLKRKPASQQRRRRTKGGRVQV